MLQNGDVIDGIYQIVREIGKAGRELFISVIICVFRSR